MTESDSLITVDDKTIAVLESAIESCSLSKLQTQTPLRRTLTLAKGMQVMRKSLQGPMFDDIKQLANTPLGFLTDRPPGTKDKNGKELTYHDATLRDAVIEGMLRGASVIGNEINVLAGRCYLTRQYFERQLREWPGLSELRITEGVPTTATNGEGAVVGMRATWKLNGHSDELICDKTVDGDTRIAVRVNRHMGVDGILGKARRKLFARIFARITGSQWATEQADTDGEVIDQPTADEQVDGDTTADSTDASSAGDEHPIFTGIEGVLAGLQTLADVHEFQGQATALLKTDEDLAKLAEWCDWRREQIRDTRGQRSNGK